MRTIVLDAVEMYSVPVVGVKTDAGILQRNYQDKGLFQSAMRD